ncbi:MAG: MJ1477/TM1410 family putative glycoside hydrolase [Promethearchaeota archaeon]
MEKNKKIILILVIICIIIAGTIGLFYIFSFFLKSVEDENDNMFEELDRVSFTINGTKIDDFAYWLQDIEISTIANSKYDLIIMDYSSDGNETGEFSKTEVKYMKSTEDEKKFLLSYLSIGEAETYRFYWNWSWDANSDGIPDAGAPKWLDVENPEWEGNYKVKYWYNGWQNIVFNYIDRIINAGFSGIYMDIIDAYEYYEGLISHSDWKMINFVVNISDYCKANAGQNFSIFVQNGDELLLNSTYLSHIDGIGREDLFYDDDDKTDKSWRNEGINNLNRALNSDKVVLITDYPTSENNIYDFYENCVNNNYLPYAAERDLDSLKEYSFYPPT